MNTEKRIPNFTPNEKECLFNIIAKYSHILEDKKTNRISIEEKKQAWKEIEKSSMPRDQFCFIGSQSS